MENNILPLTVIIPTYERPDALKDTLASYNLSETKAKEIIVVDQSVIYKMQNKNECEKYNNVKYIWSEIPSLPRSRNIGLKHATLNVVVFSDDDINIGPETLINVFNIMRDSHYALIGGLDINTFNKKSSLLSYAVGKKSFLKRKKGHMTKSIFGRYPSKILKETPTEWAMGYFFSIKKDLCFANNIFFDENLEAYAYAEDLDFTYRYCSKANKMKLKTILTPNVIVNHKVSNEYRTPSEKLIKYLFLNRGYIAHKLNIRGSYLAIKWANFWIQVYARIHKENIEFYKKANKELKYHIKTKFRNFNK